MLSCIKNFDCVSVLQLLWEQNCFNLAFAKEVAIISYPESCLSVHSAVCAYCPAPLAPCSSVLALICLQSWGAEVFCVWTSLAGFDCCIKDPVQGDGALSFAAEAFTVYSEGRLLEGQWVGFMLTLVQQYEEKRVFLEGLISILLDASIQLPVFPRAWDWEQLMRAVITAWLQPSGWGTDGGGCHCRVRESQGAAAGQKGDWGIGPVVCIGNLQCSVLISLLCPSSSLKEKLSSFWKSKNVGTCGQLIAWETGEAC